MTILLLFGEASGTQAGSISYVGWWIGGQGANVGGVTPMPWLVGRTITIVTPGAAL